MRLLKRKRTARPPTTDGDNLPVPVATAPALARTERALQLLAVQSARLHASIVQLEHRVDTLSETVMSQLDAPSFDDIHHARMQTSRVAAELARLEINIAARIDELRSYVPAEVDLRTLTPAETGW